MALDWQQLLIELEDVVFPQKSLDSWERTLYLHLLRRTHAEGSPTGVFAIAPLSKALPISDIKVREVLRSLHTKGCVQIQDRSRLGHEVTVFLPSEIDGLSRVRPVAESIDIESLDFFDRKYVAPLLKREQFACFYCLRTIDAKSCELDHVIPQVERPDNTYRNIVCACHTCNKGKGSQAADTFLRARYRLGLLSDDELGTRLSALVALKDGQLKPRVAGTDA